MTTIHCIECDDDFVIYWRENENFVLKTFQIFLSMFERCNNDQQIFIECFFIALREASSHYIERNYSFFQKFESLFDLKQLFLNKIDRKIELKKENNNILILQVFNHCDLRSSCVCKTINTINDWISLIYRA